MVCYIVPTLAGLVHYGMSRKMKSWRSSQKHRTLNYLFAGGAIFGIVDHLWNGELFAAGPDLAKDLALGLTITAAILAAWWIVILAQQSRATSGDDAKASD